MAAEGDAAGEIGRIGILGAGTMGAGIAQVVVEAGMAAVVHDPIPGAYQRAHEKVTGFLARRVEKGQLDAGASATAIDRLSEAGSLEGLAVADFVIEAIPEELTLKSDAFRQLDALTEPGTILASNTSSLSIGDIALATQHPERVVGMHFFNPVPLMALIEVIPGRLTTVAVTEATMEFARRLGKTPVRAADTPGFIVNRVARPFYLEALRIVGDGSAGIEQVDAAMRSAGFRMGPFELIDTIGADVNLAVSESTYQAFDNDPRFRPHPLQRTLVEAGRLGRKSGAGFYDYEADGARGAPWRGAGMAAAPRLSGDEIAARILATLVNEGASAVADGVARPEAIDTAMQLGANYPHGPLEWGERLGLQSVVATLDALHSTVPDGRYRIVPLLRSLAESHGSFFEPAG